jgi:hypothetical protein
VEVRVVERKFWVRLEVRVRMRVKVRVRLSVEVRIRILGKGLGLGLGLGFCLVLSCLFVSCLVLSCLVLSCLVLSCLVLSDLVFVFRSALSWLPIVFGLFWVRSCPVLSYLIWSVVMSFGPIMYPQKVVKTVVVWTMVDRRFIWLPSMVMPLIWRDKASQDKG